MQVNPSHIDYKRVIDLFQYYPPLNSPLC